MTVEAIDRDRITRKALAAGLRVRQARRAAVERRVAGPQTYVAYIETAAGDYVELPLRVWSAGEARYLAQRAQVGGKIIDVMLCVGG